MAFGVWKFLTAVTAIRAHHIAIEQHGMHQSINGVCFPSVTILANAGYA
jgi:hypothetical protein